METKIFAPEHARRIVENEIQCNENFIAAVMELGLSYVEAEMVFKYYRKVKVIKIDRINERWTVKHSAFWNREVILNALKAARK